MTTALPLNELLPLKDAITEVIAPVIGPFRLDTTTIADPHGGTAGPFDIVAHTQAIAAGDSAMVDTVPLVIDCYESLSIQSIRDAYGKAAAVKRLMKSPDPSEARNNTEMTMVVVLARHSDLALEEIAEEMKCLNASGSSSIWPDAIAVLGKGLINYSARVPGTGQSGDFMLPAIGTAEVAPSPSLDVELVIRPMAEMTLNKVASFAMIRCALFDLSAGLADYHPLIASISNRGVSVKHYQFSTTNQLAPVSKEQEISYRLSSKVFNIVSGSSRLGSIQYRTWQDGGVFIVQGGFPLDLFLFFLRQVEPSISSSSMQYFRSKEVQVSYVLPVTEAQFHQALALFQSRSNMRVVEESSKILVQKIGNEGSSTPFLARLMLGIMNLRDAVYETQEHRQRFDDYYDSVLSNLRSARDASKEIKTLWASHSAKISSGEIVNTVGRNVQIREHIDRQLKREIETFLNSSVRAIKTGLQTLAKDLGIDFGFLFGQEAKFQSGAAGIRAGDPELADYLIETRKWSEPLVLVRNDLEHTNISSVQVQYHVDRTPVEATQPEFQGLPLTDYCSTYLDHVCCFAEEITALCLRRKLPTGLDITELPLARRDSDAPERFRLTVTPGGMPPWRLIAHTKTFDTA